MNEQYISIWFRLVSKVFPGSSSRVESKIIDKDLDRRVPQPSVVSTNTSVYGISSVRD